MDSSTIEQMNKLRKTLNLPLLALPNDATTGPQFKSKPDSDKDGDKAASTLESREAAGISNFQRLQDEQRRKKERDERKKQIQKSRDAAARLQRLEGKGLGDLSEGDEEQDAKSWLRGQQKRQRKIEDERKARLESELQERERNEAKRYDSRDLAGVQVAHGIDDFEDTANGQILTLQDREIGDDGNESDEPDVLENAEIIAKDKLQEKLDAKKRVRYDVHDEEKNTLLSQYDEKKRKAFTLDDRGGSLEESESKRQAVSEKLRSAISLDEIFKPEPVSDYLEIKIKKPKREKKHKRKREEDNVVNEERDDVLMQEAGIRYRQNGHEFEDDSYSRQLALQRQAAGKKRRVATEDLVKQIREEDNTSPGQPDEEAGIVLDDTTAFLDHLEARPVQDDAARKATGRNDRTDDQDNVDVAMAEAESQAYLVLEHDETALLGAVLEQKKAEEAAKVDSTGLAKEQTLSNGLGSTLELLRSRGLVKEDTSKVDKNDLLRSRTTFHTQTLMRQHKAEQAAKNQRAYDRSSGKLANMSQRDREALAQQENERRSQQASIAEAARFNREYKPDVEIKYVDDDGRLMDQKAAFKHLSHQFHGKGSGKGKTEKALKKRAEEKKREEKGILDGSRGVQGTMQDSIGAVGRRDKVAGVRLG